MDYDAELNEIIDQTVSGVNAKKAIARVVKFSTLALDAIYEIRDKETRTIQSDLPKLCTDEQLVKVHALLDVCIPLLEAIDPLSQVNVPTETEVKNA